MTSVSPSGTGPLPLHAGVDTGGPLLLALAVATAFSVVVVLLSVAAYLRRRTTSYLFVAAAFATVLGKTTLGIASVTGWIDTGTHHLAEHVLDAAMLALVLAAVYYARASER